MDETLGPSESSPQHHRLRKLGKRAVAAVGLAVALTVAAAPPASAEKPKQPSSAQIEKNLEKAAELQRQATVQLRYRNRYSQSLADGAKETIKNTDSLCTATHVGNGLFLTARHCFDNEFIDPSKKVSASSDEKPYDISKGTLENEVSIWRGNDLKHLKRVGEVRGLVMHDSQSTGDFALVYAPALKSMPAVKVAETVPNPKDTYYIAGYPNVKQSKFQHTLGYLTNVRAGEFYDSFGLGNDVELYAFGGFATPEEGAALCQKGMSGGSIVNSKGEAVGLLSRYDAFAGDHFLARAVENNLQAAGQAMPDINVVCAAQIITPHLVTQYEKQLGHQAPAAA